MSLRIVSRSLLFVFLFTSCGEEAGKPDQSSSDHPNKFHNKELLQVCKWKDLRLSDPLVKALQDDNELIRAEAALALASVIDTATIAALEIALSDSVWQVRINAAFAIGQIGDSTAVDALAEAYKKEPVPNVRLEMLQALGKCTSQKSLDLIDSFAPATREDSLGMMWGYYRLGLRRPLSPVSIERTVGFLGSQDPWLRTVAGNVLVRSKGVDLSPHKDAVLDRLNSGSDAETRMALCLALRAVNDDEVRKQLVKMAREDEDARVRVNAVRALGSSVHWKPTIDDRIEILQNATGSVAVQLATGLKGDITKNQAQNLLAIIEQGVHPEVSTEIHKACLASRLPEGIKSDIRKYIQQGFLLTSDINRMALWMRALGGDTNSLDFVAEKMFRAKWPVVTTAGINSLVEIHRKLGSSRNFEMAEHYLQALNSKDVTMIGLAAGAIIEMDVRDERISSAKLVEVRDGLELPREVEAWIELQKATNHINGVDAEVVAPKSYSPVDWEYVKKIPKDQQVRIETSKGQIILDVFVEETPASVARFLHSVEDGFYNGKTFHRVVPNFVAQGGCPRGDGWGSPDWSLRSEFTTRHYETGAVGLASAGRDTESCQFFFTHSPTPHLDGRYTLFGKVTDGLDVLQQLALGDIIQKAELIP